MKVHQICSFKLFSNYWNLINLSSLINHSILTTIFVLLGWFFLYPSLALAVIQPKIRTDLASAFRKVVCNSYIPSHPLDLWKLGVYESQISGKIFKPVKNLGLQEDFIQVQAISNARKNHHHSFAWGSCGNNSSWIATFPAGGRISTTDRQLYKMAKKPLDTYCRSYQADYVSAASGQKKRLAMRQNDNYELEVDASNLNDGTLSISCLPKANDWQGATTWFLAPVKNGPSVKVPFTSNSYFFEKTKENFIKWIAQVRASEGLAPLKTGDINLDSATKSLAFSNGIIHDRRSKKMVQEIISRSNLQIIGENRVKGRSYMELTWLLWNSPKHRSLLLSKKATHLGIHVKKIGPLKLAVLLSASAKP